MCPAVCVCHSRQFFVQQMILLQTVRDQNSFVAPVKLQRLFVIPAFLVFVDHHRTFLIELPGTVYPHVAFTVRTVTVTDHLCRCFVRLCHRQGQQLLLHAFHKRCKIFLSTPDDPVRHGLSGDIYTIALKLLLDSVQCRGVHIFYIQNGCKQGRSNDASTQKILGAFST